jgi:hypothetical protein
MIAKQIALAMVSRDEYERIKAAAAQRGYDSVDAYVRALLAADEQADEDDDDLDYVRESIRQGLREALRGEVVSEEDFWRLIQEDADEYLRVRSSNSW